MSISELARLAPTVVVREPLMQTFALGELFAGAGGMALGAHWAKYEGCGFEHVWANDMDKEACETLRHNLPIEAKRVVCGLVEKLDLKKLKPIDGLVFGFPCNDFSAVGSRQGISGHYGSLYKWGGKALGYFQPNFFVAENVGGIQSSNKSKDIDIILKTFEKEGYDLRVDKYKFEEYGIPQNRHRIFIIGFKKSLQISDNYQLPQKVLKQKTAREAIMNPPIDKDAKNHEFTQQSATVVKRLEYIKQGENAFTADMPDVLRLNLNSGATISQIYRRLTADKPAYTVTGSGGGGTHVYHWEECRALTNRERARLQTFPDNFNFHGGKESVRKQIGMAVPPEGAQLIFRQVLKVLIDNKIESINDNR